MFDYKILHVLFSFVYLNFIRSILSKVHNITNLYINGTSRSIFKDFPSSNGDNFSFLGLFLAVWENDSAFCGGFLNERLDENVIF
jgi:hypothetical protein